MKPKSSVRKSPTKASAEAVIKVIRRQTRRHFSAEDKIRIVLDGLRGEDILKRRETIKRKTIEHRRLLHRKLAA